MKEKIFARENFDWIGFINRDQSNMVIKGKTKKKDSLEPYK